LSSKPIIEFLEAMKRAKKTDIKITDEELADYLEDLKYRDEKKFFEYISHLPNELKAETIIELPTRFQQDLIDFFTFDELAVVINSLETDDATDFMQLISEQSKQKEKSVLSLLDREKLEIIKKLRSYSENEAGSLMQHELFSANIDEKIETSLERLRRLKKNRNLKNIHYVFIVNNLHQLLKIVPFEDLILKKESLTYREIIDEFDDPIVIEDREDLREAIWLIEQNDISILPVISKNRNLLGRITHDDILDEIEKKATKEMYSLASVDKDEEVHDTVLKTTKSRAIWLFINLINITLVSIVIGFFEETIKEIVALAVLMPIVANMAGNASMQTLTVIVRQISIGEIEFKDAKNIFFKEMSISVINGLAFALLATIISIVRFDSFVLGFVMALAMLCSFLVAGFTGVIVPLTLKKLKIDPAIASSVIILTLMDVVGFFMLLYLAKTLILS